MVRRSRELLERAKKSIAQFRKVVVQSERILREALERIRNNRQQRIKFALRLRRTTDTGIMA